VYDLEVEGSHSYISNNIVSHNSAMLQYIRNVAPRSVYTSGKGSSSAGLCVTGDTVIHTEDGFRPIREIVTNELSDPVDVETAVERAVGVQTFDREKGEMMAVDSSQVWRMPEKPCCRIETNYGQELEASVNTPILTCGENGIEWRKISELEPGDYVAVPRYDGIDRSEVPVRKYLELSTEKVQLSEASVSFLRQSLQDEFGTLRDAAAALNLSEDFIYLHLKNRHVPLEKLDRMLNAIGETREAVEFDRLMVRHGDSIAMPEVFDADLMYLLGLVFGDGDISLDRRGGNRGLVRISNSNEELLERAIDIFDEKFDTCPDIEYQDDKVPCIRVSSATIARLFSNAGMQTPKEELALASELTVAEHADSFLRGVMDADGSVSVRDTGGSSVLMSTISEELARQLQLMLETYGVRARTRERDRRGTYELDGGQTIESKHVQYFVEIYGADVDRYAEAIGFESAKKQQALSRAAASDRRRRELLPIGAALAGVEGVAGEYYQNIHRGDNPGRARARTMLDDIDLGAAEPEVRETVEADLRWAEVVATVDTGHKEVFDLTVPETHNFVGNGIITHNTAAAVRDDFGDGQQWTLEAGALVLADQGIAAVDELDKMRCVAGDTLVHLADGRISRIRALARDAARTGTIEELPNGRTIRDTDLRAWTMTDDGRLVDRPVTAVHEYDAPAELTRVSLESGETVTSTDDHPFFVFEDCERVERPASDLQPGDWVYVPAELPTSVADGGTTATVAPERAEPSTTATAFGAVLGYLSGDGNVYYDSEAGSYGIRFTNKERELLEEFERACRDAFDAEPVRHPSEQRDDGVGTVRLHGREYADAVLDAGMNLETYDRKAFPREVSDGCRGMKAAFVRAVADSEGTVDTSAGNVRIHSASEELLRGVKGLLLEFGISCQIQSRNRTGKLDLYVLGITAADSLRAYDRHIGFSLERKQSALEEVRAAVDGDRTILDVVPDCGELLEELRESLRLYQSECGLDDATYCNFENGDANLSLHRGRAVLDRFEERVERAAVDTETFGTQCDWNALEELKERYNVSQRELAADSAHSQQEISRRWGDDEELREHVHRRLERIVEGVARTDVSPLAELVDGDVKWRRIADVETVDSEYEDDRIPVLHEELADLIGCESDAAELQARELLERDVDTTSWTGLREGLERHGVPLSRIATELGVAESTVSRWFNGVVETDRFDDVRAVAERRVSGRRDEIRRRLEEIEYRRTPKVYDLTVEGTHNFVANGAVIHNSEDRSAMHEALEQQSYHPDTEILLSDGRRVEIGPFVDERMSQAPDAVVDGVDCEILPVDDVGVHSTDFEANETTKLPVDRVSRHEAPDEFVRVTFSNGREVTVTPEHPMFVDDGCGVGTVEAGDIEAGAFVPAPRKLPNSSAAVELDDEPHVAGEKDVDLPTALSGDLAEILGLLVAQGHSYAGSAHEIGFSNQDERLLRRMDRLMSSVFGMESTDTTNAAGTVTKRWVSTKLYRWFEANFPEVTQRAREKRMPAAVLGASEEEIRRFLVGAFAGDGGVESEAMSFSTASEGLARDYADALSKVGVASRIHHDSAEESWKVYVMGDSTERFVDEVVDPDDDRHGEAVAFVERSDETPRYHDVLPTRSSDRTSTRATAYRSRRSRRNWPTCGGVPRRSRPRSTRPRPSAKSGRPSTGRVDDSPNGSTAKPRVRSTTPRTVDTTPSGGRRWPGGHERPSTRHSRSSTDVPRNSKGGANSGTTASATSKPSRTRARTPASGSTT